MSDLSNKTYTMETEFELIAKTFQGLENVLAKELTDLGANNIQTGRRMVSFTGDKELMYRANFALRTAASLNLSSISRQNLPIRFMMPSRPSTGISI